MDPLLDAVAEAGSTTVECHVQTLATGPAQLVLSVAVAAGATLGSESLVVTHDGDALRWREVVAPHGTRLHLVDVARAGAVNVVYRAEVVRGDRATGVTVDGADDIDVVTCLRPSRYCESDRIGGFARTEFGGRRGRELLAAATEWVGGRLAYLPGSSRPIDGAVASLLSGQGVCRDFAHLLIALLRACDVPARMVSVYAPGLYPMDFHAVVEAFVDGAWVVADATGLAPRSTLVRIATGRDAADTAFLSAAGDAVVLEGIEVVAYTDGVLPFDDRSTVVQLG